MSSTQRRRHRMIETLRQAAGYVNERPEIMEDGSFSQHVADQIAAGGGNGADAAGRETMAFLTQETLRAMNQRDQLLAATKAFQEQLRESPKPVRILSKALPFAFNGSTRHMVWAQNLGSSSQPAFPVTMLDEETELPERLDLAFVDSGCKVLLGRADGVPIACQESTVVDVGENDEFELGEVLIRDAGERQIVLWCSQDMVEQIARLLESGAEVAVRHDGSVVVRVVERDVRTGENWLEWVDLDGPLLSEMIFPNWLKILWEKNVLRMSQGRSVKALCMGGTGTGKSESPIRAGREAAKRCGRPLVVIRFSLARMGSSYWSQTEQNIVKIKEQAVRLVNQGNLVVILVDEADALLGNSEGRFESATGRSVRNTFQSEFSESPGPFCSIFLTMNVRKDSWLPAPIQRRFRKIIYPSPTRGQIARIAAAYADANAMGNLDTTPEAFGRQMADFVYSDAFRIARVIMHSGRQFTVRARDLRDVSPGRIKSLVEGLCEDVADEIAPSSADYWTELDRELRSVSLNEANLYELTYLDLPENDTVRRVERVEGGSTPLNVDFAVPV